MTDPRPHEELAAPPASSGWTRAMSSALADKSQLSLHVRGRPQCRAGCRSQGLRRRRGLHGRPALARHIAEAVGGPALRRRHHRRRLLLSSWSATPCGPPPRPLRRGGDLAWRSGRSGVGVTAARHRAAGAVRDAVRLRGSPDPVRLIHQRHMHEYGTTLEQWAQVRCPRAVGRPQSKAKNREPMTVQDVLDSAPWSALNVLKHLSGHRRGGRRGHDAGRRAKDCAKKPCCSGRGRGVEHVMLTQIAA